MEFQLPEELSLPMLHPPHVAEGARFFVMNANEDDGKMTELRMTAFLATCDGKEPSRMPATNKSLDAIFKITHGAHLLAVSPCADGEQNGFVRSLNTTCAHFASSRAKAAQAARGNGADPSSSDEERRPKSKKTKREKRLKKRAAGVEDESGAAAAATAPPPPHDAGRKPSSTDQTAPGGSADAKSSDKPSEEPKEGDSAAGGSAGGSTPVFVSCTCPHWHSNGNYCKHVVVVCDHLGVVSLEMLTTLLVPRRSAGKPRTALKALAKSEDSKAHSGKALLGRLKQDHKKK